MVETRATVLAWIRCALVELHQTGAFRLVLVASTASACVLADAVLAGPAVQAGFGGTLIDLRFTIPSLEARKAFTDVMVVGHRSLL